MENIIIFIIFMLIFAYKYNFIVFYIKQIYNNDLCQYSTYCIKVNKLIDDMDKHSVQLSKLEKQNKRKLTKMIQLYDVACATIIKNEKKIFNREKYKIITMSIQDQIKIVEDRAKDIVSQNYDAIILKHIKSIKFRNV